jgi:hypothetical protein
MSQDQRTGQATDRTEDEIEARCKRRRMYIHPQPFHQDFRCGGIRADINTDMAHDTDKHQQDKRVTQQGKAFGERGRLAFRRFFFDVSRP